MSITNTLQHKSDKYKQLVISELHLTISGPSNLTTGCIAATHGEFTTVHPHLIHALLSPAKFKSQTASQSVQLFLRSSPQSVPILYNGPPSPSPPLKLPVLMGDLNPT